MTSIAALKLSVKQEFPVSVLGDISEHFQASISLSFNEAGIFERTVLDLIRCVLEGKIFSVHFISVIKALMGNDSHSASSVALFTTVSNALWLWGTQVSLNTICL